MMTLHARQSRSPFNHPGCPLPTYPVDSPRAKARHIVVALLADGEARLFWKALDTWCPRLDDGIEYRPRTATHRQRGRRRQTASTHAPGRIGQ